MIALAKALPFGALLAWIVASVLGAGGAPPAILAVRVVAFAGVTFYWSWPVFLAGTVLAWAIFKMME